MIHLPKSYPAPACLAIEKEKASGNYNCGDVYERLKQDFKNKCYICEFKAPTAINAEHFVPHRSNIDLKFAWENLFFVCVHCNNTKLAKPDFDDILNCTIHTDEVDKKIKYEIKPLPKELVQISPVENSPCVINTVKLLTAVYNGTTPLKLIESINLRDALLKEIRTFHDLLFAFDDDDNEPDEKEHFRNKIIKELGAGSNFTAFKRWIIRESTTFKAEFATALG